MKIPCYDCNTETELEVGFEVVNFVCPKCHSLYARDDAGQFRRKNKYKGADYNAPLAIGDVGFLKGSEYKVVGILVKKIHPDYSWMEFILQNDKKEFLYLSLSDGHWILLTEMEETFNVKSHPLVLEHDGKDYEIYDYSNTLIINAEGFFDFELPQNTIIYVVEYIRPPYMISIETVHKADTAFYGEYIKKSEIRKAFKKVFLPYQSGVNVIQPSRFDLRNTAIIFCCFALLILTANWYIYKDQVEQNVFNSAIKFDEFNNKEMTTPSFVLNGASAPMTIRVSTAVNNSWANLNIALINEDNGDETYASKDIEYYYGSSEGESWTEGSQSEKFNICGVKAGKYHLSITPMKAPEDLSTTTMNVSVVWNQPSSRNVWLVLIGMIALYFIIRYFKNQFERKRWADSSYSTYD
ncbi:DUF4178 domain-containing protein [Flavobacterium panacagri]|uniref:DUF4178 domain-containing protein n=1 Tax=Flavobacterium panacagri TaxID=3034146 RepID=UPI0025A60586|nr:DUF4178 domain-containing protein [Flavobacterium panacagri]